MKRLILGYRYWPLFILVWTSLVLVSFIWNKGELESKSFQLAHDRASFVFKLVQASRLWAARHGSLYVPVTDKTQPNPYLLVENRDFTTDFGQDLTMVNPAYMTRQLGEVVEELSGLKLHLTSLDPFNPVNTPDDWEREQLERIDRNEINYSSELIGPADNLYFRHLAPLYVEEPCMRCHQKQGYQLGEVRGAVSISFPVEQLQRLQMQHLHDVALTHGLVWLLLTILTLFGLAHFRRQLLDLENAHAHTERQVLERTSELHVKVREHQQAEAQLQLFIDSSGEGILAMDTQGVCTLVNPRACQMLGLQAAGELLGKPLHQAIHYHKADGTSHPEHECPICATLHSGEQVHQEDDLFWRADGSSFPVEFRAHPLFAETRLIGVVITFNDISARKAREDELRKLSSALEHSPSSAVITNSKGQIEYVNPHFVGMTGYQPEDVIGKNPSILQSGEMPSEVYRDMWETISAGNIWTGQLLNRSKDGRLFWELARISPIQNAQGEITHYIAIKDDITDSKAKEDQIWQQAHHDALTGLANRNLLQETIREAMRKARANEGQLALLYIDLDGFKQVNDRYGHAAGDQVLVEAARRITSVLRSTDMAARLGGDEFVVVLTQFSGMYGVGQVADKLLEVLQQDYRVEGDICNGISASVGLAIYPLHACSDDTLLQAADYAMYRAKQSGRNCWAAYSL